MKKFEFKIETIEIKDFTDNYKKRVIDKKINALGKEGWDLAQMESIVSDGVQAP